MKSERVSFKGALGHDLAARLDSPAGKPAAYALFAHCFTCSKDLLAVSRVSRALVDRGLAVLRFDFTGLGESGGDFAETSFSSNLDDLDAAVDFLRSRDQAPQLLIGHSLGGAAVLSVAGQIPEVRAVATIGAPSDTQHLHDSLLRSAPDLATAEEVEVQLAGRPFKVRREFLEDLRQDRVLQAIRQLGRALIVFHSPTDEVVGIEHAARIYQAARHPKSFVSLDGADHLLLSRPEDARFVADVLATWSSRYLDLPAPASNNAAPASDQAAPASDKAMGANSATPPEPGEVLVSGGPTGLVQNIHAGRHHQLADEPTRFAGGTDQGPNPYDYLLTALGSCTSMTLRLYADRKGWDLQGVDVRLRHAKIHAADCMDCESTSGKIDLIEREITLHGQLDETQRARLLEIADRCPVHRTMTSETKIRSRLI